VVLLIGDLLPPGRLRAAVAAVLHQGEVLHESVGGGAVPVLLPRWGVDRVAGAGLDDRAVPAADQGDAGDDVQGLAQGVGVPAGSNW
jgi:hypothetical protein